VAARCVRSRSCARAGGGEAAKRGDEATLGRLRGEAAELAAAFPFAG
jgi:hypothetical protein